MDKMKGFIFDLDGVVVDTAHYHFLAWRDLAQGLGIAFSEEDNEQLKGVSRIGSLEKILSWGEKSLTENEFEELITSKNEDYLSYVNRMTAEEILPDVPRVLKFLRDSNQKMALGSASKNARTILKKVQLLDDFDAIIDGTDVTTAKPDPEVFQKAAEALGVLPEKCVVFEDALAGIEAANRAEMLSIGIGDARVLKDADFVFRDFTQVSNEFLNQLIQQ